MAEPRLETARLHLRRPREEDLAGWIGLMGDEEAARFIGGVQTPLMAWFTTPCRTAVTSAAGMPEGLSPES